MSEEILHLLRGINSIIQNSEAVSVGLIAEVCQSIRLETGLCSAVTDKSGTVLFNNGKLDANQCASFRNEYEAREFRTDGFCVLVIPLKTAGLRNGTYICSNNDGMELTAAHKAAAEAASALCSLVLANDNKEQAALETVSAAAAKSVIDTLSYSELEAAVAVINRLENGDGGLREGLVVASRIAEEYGITRTVIVNAIRKLESAGVLESQSLGAKGTFIKVTNVFLTRQLGKLN